MVLLLLTLSQLLARQVTMHVTVLLVHSVPLVRLLVPLVLMAISGMEQPAATVLLVPTVPEVFLLVLTVLLVNILLLLPHLLVIIAKLISTVLLLPHPALTVLLLSTVLPAQHLVLLVPVASILIIPQVFVKTAILVNTV